jgi:hypothetical protein
MSTFIYYIYIKSLVLRATEACFENCYYRICQNMNYHGVEHNIV